MQPRVRGRTASTPPSLHHHDGDRLHIGCSSWPRLLACRHVKAPCGPRLRHAIIADYLNAPLPLTCRPSVLHSLIPHDRSAILQHTQHDLDHAQDAAHRRVRAAHRPVCAPCCPEPLNSHTQPASSTTSSSKASTARPLRSSIPQTSPSSPPSTRLPRRMSTLPWLLPARHSKAAGERRRQRTGDGCL